MQQPKASGWFEERLQIGPVLRGFLDRLVPRGVGWWYTLGSATLFVFMLQLITGATLTLYYAPSPDHAYQSIQYIMNDVAFGNLIRGIHHWSASAMVLLCVLHGLRTFFFGAYKYPRELTWILGTLLVFVVLGFSFTGYLLPWDQKAYWAIVVGTSIAGSAPYIGDFLLKLLRGGTEVGAVTLARFYSMHVVLLPLIAAALVGIHVWLVVKLGITAPPKDMDKGMTK